VVSSGGRFVDPNTLLVAPNGDLLIADINDVNPGMIIRVNPMTGAQTLVSSGGFFANPNYLALEATGNLVVADSDAFPLSGCNTGCGAVIRVDPVTGAQTVVSSGGFFVNPVGIALEADGNILVGDPDALGGGGAIIRVNPATGAQTVISSGGAF